MTQTPGGIAVIAPFVMADRAQDLIDFIVHVFGARDVPEDPWGNLWWVYVHHPQDADQEWSAEGAHPSGDEGEGEGDWTSYTTPELEYINSTLMQAMDGLRDPRDAR